MEFDFDNYKYFGHATDKNPMYSLDNGIRIKEDVFGKHEVRSTTIEITPNDISDGIDDMLTNVFSIGMHNWRNYVVIIACDKEEYENFCAEVEYSMCIPPEYIVGYFDEDKEFTENDNFMLGNTR